MTSGRKAVLAADTACAAHLTQHVYRFDKQQACSCPSFLEAVWLSKSVRDVRLSIVVPPDIPGKQADPSGWHGLVLHLYCR